MTTRSIAVRINLPRRAAVETGALQIVPTGPRSASPGMRAPARWLTTQGAEKLGDIRMTATGSWKITLSTPMGPQDMTGIFTANGSALTGSIESPLGSEAISGTVDGDTLKWDMNVTKPMPLTLSFDITVDGDTLAGTCKLGMFGNGGVSGVRI